MATEFPPAAAEAPSFRQDLAVLTKVRLNTFVLITTVFGFVLATQTLDQAWTGRHWLLLLNTIVGTACAAFGSAAFNQLMEIEQDLRMQRTADRPLPSRRMGPTLAFGIGWILSAFGIIHLSATVSPAAASLAAITLGSYVFVYTPLKRRSSVNTLVGAIPGAIPPMIGWAGAGADALGSGSWFLFALLFFWQLPHFVAINWLCREDYEEAGYKMWANGDVSGQRSALIAFGFGIPLALCGLVPPLLGLSSWWAGVCAALAGLAVALLALQFRKDPTRDSMRRLFFSTLIYLPVVIVVYSLGWN